MYEFMTFLGMAIMIAFVIIYAIYRTPLLGMFALPLTVIIVAYASVFPQEVQPLIPSLNFNWLKVHVTTAALGEAFFAVGFAAGLMYLLRVVDFKQTTKAARKAQRWVEFTLYVLVVIVGFIVAVLLSAAQGMKPSSCRSRLRRSFIAAVCDVNDKKGRFGEGQFGFQLGYFLADQSLGKVAAHIVLVARVDDWVDEVLPVIVDIAVGHVDHRDAHLRLPKHGITHARGELDRIEKAGFAAQRESADGSETAVRSAVGSSRTCSPSWARRRATCAFGGRAWIAEMRASFATSANAISSVRSNTTITTRSSAGPRTATTAAGSPSILPLIPFSPSGGRAPDLLCSPRREFAAHPCWHQAESRRQPPSRPASLPSEITRRDGTLETEPQSKLNDTPATRPYDFARIQVRRRSRADGSVGSIQLAWLRKFRPTALNSTARSAARANRLLSEIS